MLERGWPPCKNKSPEMSRGSREECDGLTTSTEKPFQFSGSLKVILMRRHHGLRFHKCQNLSMLSLKNDLDAIWIGFQRKNDILISVVAPLISDSITSLAALIASTCSMRRFKFFTEGLLPRLAVGLDAGMADFRFSYGAEFTQNIKYTWKTFYFNWKSCKHASYHRSA